jgi:hypothetical protein
MGVRARLLCLGIGAVIGLAAGTQFVAAHYGYHRALGWGFELGGGAKLYPPWDILVWAKMWSASSTHGPIMRAGAALIVLGVALGAMLVRLFDTQSGAGREGGAGVKVNYGHRARGWGDPKALIKAGLTGLEGVVLGRINSLPLRFCLKRSSFVSSSYFAMKKGTATSPNPTNRQWSTSVAEIYIFVVISP